MLKICQQKAFMGYFYPPFTTCWAKNGGKKTIKRHIA